MVYGLTRLRSVLLLGGIFIFGLNVGYISRHNPGTLLFCILTPGTLLHICSPININMCFGCSKNRLIERVLVF